MYKRSIAVIGTGYVGLVTGTCLAEKGNAVICVDNNQDKLNKLKSGVIPIYEPGLEDLVLKNVRDQNLSFTDDVEYAVKNSEIIFFCLPTPPKEDGSADLKYVEQVSESIGKYIDVYKVIVNKSTVPVGTTNRIEEILSQFIHSEFDVVSNPEFLREGVAVWDFMKPERVVIGTDSPKAQKIMVDLYRPFVEDDYRILVMDARSSEMTKYAANAFLATKISFINEIANVCELVGADVEQVANGMGMDTRIGHQFLKAGIGYGGSCFPKDVKALQNIAQSNNYNFKILSSVIDVNNLQRNKIIEKLHQLFGKDFSGKRVAIWGLAFKPNTDDLREAPALTIIPGLTDLGVKVQAFDPVAMPAMQQYYNLPIEYGGDKYEVLNQADALIILTEWDEFVSPDFEIMEKTMRAPVIIDGRNVYDPNAMSEIGFTYLSIGRREVLKS